MISSLFGRDTIYIALWLVQLVLAALLTPAVSRLLGPTRYGQAVASFAVMQVLFPVAGLSLGTAIQRCFSEPNGEQNARKVITVAIVISVVVTGVALATGPLWAPAIGFPSFLPSVRYAVVWAGLCGVTYAGLGLLKSQDRLAAFASVTLTQSLVAEAVALALVIFYQRTADAYLLGQMLCQAVAVVAILILATPRAIERGDREVISQAVRFSLSLVPAALASFVIDTSDRLIIQADLGSAAVGRYAIARNVGALAVLVIGAMNMVWMPRLFQLADAHLRRTVLVATRDATARLMAAFVLVIVMASPLILRIMAPAAYDTDGLLLVTALIGVAALPAAGSQASIRVLLLTGKTGAIATWMILTAALNLGVNLIVVPRLGLNGAALVSLFAYTAQMVLLSASARRLMPLPRPSVRLIALILGTLGLCIASTQAPTTAVIGVIRGLVALVGTTFFLAEIVRLVAPGALQESRPVIRTLGKLAPAIPSGRDKA